MKVLSLLAGVAIAAALPLTLVAQQSPSGFHTVACFKIKADKGSEFRKWAAEDLRKFVQSRIDAGKISTWYLLRSVMPAGTSAECDYLTVSMYPGAPPEPLGMEGLEEALKKAGMSMTAQQYVDRRNSLTTLVSTAMFQNQTFVGTSKKGDYFMVNYMKSANPQDWVAYEKKVWQPFAEAMTKEGVESAWSVNLQVLPGGSDLPYQGVTVDVYPSWDAVYNNDGKFVERFKKVHPDMEFGTTIEQFEKLRTISSTKLFATK
jgi:hypothetical protein